MNSPDVFFRFARELEAPHWWPYYVRWERVGRLRLNHEWPVRAEVEVHRGMGAMVRLWLPTASGRHTSPVGEASLDTLKSELEPRGYEQRSPTMFLKRFRPTAARLAAAHREIDASLWPRGRSRRPRRPLRGGIPGAMDYFLSTQWVPSSCGWSRRIRLRNGVEVLFAVLLMPREKGQGHRPEACVQLEPPKGVSRARLRGLVELAEAAGWSAEEVRPTGRAPYLFINFWKSNLGPAGAAGARARLDALAQAMRAKA